MNDPTTYRVTLNIEPVGRYWRLVRHDPLASSGPRNIVEVFDSLEMASRRMSELSEKLTWKLNALRSGNTILSMVFGWQVDGVGTLHLDFPIEPARALCIFGGRFDRIVDGDVLEGNTLRVELSEEVTCWNPVEEFDSFEACNPPITPKMSEGVNL